MPIQPTLASLESYLQFTSAREQTIASNIANVDTPGFKTHDVNFKQAMLAASNADGSAQFTPVVSEVRGLLQRPDGNNVDMDRESMMLAQAQLQYQLGVQLVKSDLHELLSAIKGE
jgi:flagellar basal-body rod protein FlgB